MDEKKYPFPAYQRGLGWCERSGDTAKYISELCLELHLAQ